MADISQKDINDLLGNVAVEEKKEEPRLENKIIHGKKKKDLRYLIEYRSPIIKKEKIVVDPPLEDIPKLINNNGFQIIYTREYYIKNRELIKEYEKKAYLI